jgi:DNA-binding transcriptional ArsR family regulator
LVTAGDCDLGALGVKQFRGRQADAAVSSRHHCYLPIQFPHIPPLRLGALGAPFPLVRYFDYHQTIWMQVFFGGGIAGIQSLRNLMDTGQMAKIAQALSDPTRLAILQAIAAAKEMNCSEVICRYNLAPGTVSHHLKTLADAGLIETRREGQFIYNRALPGALRAYAEAVRGLAPHQSQRVKR